MVNLQMMWQKEVVIYIKALLRHLPARTEENHDQSVSQYTQCAGRYSHLLGRTYN